MIQPTRLHGVRKGALGQRMQQARLPIRNALPADLSGGAATRSRRSDERLGLLKHVPAGLSAAAVHLLVANLAWADAPDQALSTLQAVKAPSETSIAETPDAPGQMPPAQAAPAPALAASAESLLALEAEPPGPGAVAAAAEPAQPVSQLAAEAADAPAPAPAPVPVPVPVVEAEAEAVQLAAEAAVPSPVVHMDIPAMPAIGEDTDVQTLVSALVRNERFLSALVNNEAFLDRLAGEERVVQELVRRKGLSIEVEARGELAAELQRRQAMMGALAARGEAAVVAVADAARQAAEAAEAAARSETREAEASNEVGVVSSGRSALVAMETAVELLEDSRQLMQALESDTAAGPLLATESNNLALERGFEKMEAAVAQAEQSVGRTLQASASEPLPAIQGAVRELYGGEQEVPLERAYTDLVAAVAELQRAYGSAVSRAVGHAVSEVAEVEEAALQGAEKTRLLVSQKVEDVEKAVRISSPPRAAMAKVAEQPTAADASSAQESGVADPEGAASVAKKEPVLEGLRLPVLGALLFWIWGTFVQPRSRYSR